MVLKQEKLKDFFSLTSLFFLSCNTFAIFSKGKYILNSDTADIFTKSFHTSAPQFPGWKNKPLHLCATASFPHRGAHSLCHAGQDFWHVCFLVVHWPSIATTCCYFSKAVGVWMHRFVDFCIDMTVLLKDRQRGEVYHHICN